ncbi:MAG: DUF2169 domain-containing protein [Acidobacteria bacterium]|nr:DUF2169 domain-containing protein [Acidobacteriota bacterium]
MQLLNATRIAAGYTLGIDPDAREHLLVVVKATYSIPPGGGEPTPAGEQVPLVLADTFTGEPGRSAPVHESDFALRKPKCDVLLLGSAYAPGGRPAERVTVSLQAGAMKKSFDVVGDRVWSAMALGQKPTRPRPFTVMPISYDRAYGGVDDSDPDKVDACLANPAGVGHNPRRRGKELDGRPLPNTEETGKPISAPSGPYRPMSFGPIGRSWPPRPRFAGTYDDAWLANTAPFLPRDFDDRYHQCAPPDQQIDFPVGGEKVELLNLTPDGRLAFTLPALEVPLEFTGADWERTIERAAVDTIVIEPDRQRLVLVGRASLPLRRNIFDVRQVVVGRMPAAWYRARDLGKTYYPSLAALVRERREAAG